MAISKGFSHYLPYIYIKFPFVSQSDIYKILRFGWFNLKKLTLNNILLYFKGELVSIKSVVPKKYYGNIITYDYKYRDTLLKKIAYLIRLRKLPYDGYYYFYMSNPKYREFLKENKENIKYNKKYPLKEQKKYLYRNITLYKFYDLVWLKSWPKRNIFRYPIADETITNSTEKIFCETLETSKIESICDQSRHNNYKTIKYSTTDYQVKNYKIEKNDIWRHKHTNSIRV